MKISITRKSLKKINFDTNLEVTDKSDLLLKVEKMLDYLMTHNKNYTQKQYYTIVELMLIFKAITVREE